MSRFERVLKRLFFSISHKTRFTRFVAWLNCKNAMILCYHGVTQAKHPNANGLHLRAARFVDQLDYLKRHYRVLALREYLLLRKTGSRVPSYSVILTFDDGFRNFLTAAAPKLVEREMPATVFLITDRIRNERSSALVFPDWEPAHDESCLSWDEVRMLRERVGIDFGSHTCSHRRLSAIRAEEAEQEMRKSLAEITKRLSIEDVSLAYPYGDRSEKVRELARSSGYVAGLTTDEGTNGPDRNIFELRRTLIGDDDDEAAFAARVSGLVFLGRRALRPVSKRGRTP
jgi:peptidoglycan/xylan/chitin deacetylase (PgdA/CDA1 family)